MKELTYEDLRKAERIMRSRTIAPMTYILPVELHRLAYLNYGRTIQHRITNSKIYPSKFKTRGGVTYITAEELYI